MPKEVTDQDITHVVDILAQVDAQEQRSMNALEGELSTLLLHGQLLRKLGEQLLRLGDRKSTDEIRSTIKEIRTNVLSRFGSVLAGKTQDPALENAFVNLESQLQTLSHIQFYDATELAEQAQLGAKSDLARQIQKEINRIPLADIVIKLRRVRADWSHAQQDKEHLLIEEYKLLAAIDSGIDSSREEQRKEWAAQVAQTRIIFNDLLGRQKELLTEWNMFLKDQRTMEAIVARLAKNKTITKAALKGVIATFTAPHEFTSFFGRIIKHQGKIEDKEKVLASLSRGSEYAARQAIIRETLAQTRGQSDPLTGIPLRAVCEKTVATELIRFQRSKNPFSLLIIDADKFKSVNDTYGHHAGDEALKLIVTACRRALRDTDSLCRWGGEEFIAILPETEKKGAIITAQRLREAVIAQTAQFAQQHPLLRRPSITISVGIASAPDDGQTEEVLFARADGAVYAAKGAGRDCTGYYDGETIKTTTKKTETGVTKRFFKAVVDAFTGSAAQ